MPVRETYKRVWIKDEGFYGRMLNRHQAMWKFLKAVVAMTNAGGNQRIFEVGGGSGGVSEWTTGGYTNVERNVGMVDLGREKYPKAQFILDDFVHMDTRLHAGKNWNTFLAGSVVEHCAGYQAFILRALDVDPNLAIIVFFRGLLWPEDRIARMVSPDAVYFENHYSGRSMAAWLEGVGLHYEFFTVKHDQSDWINDVVLVIDVHKEKTVEFWNEIDSLGYTRRGYGEWARENWEAKRLQIRQDHTERGVAAQLAARDIGRQE